jgi:hypothetical protein
MEAGSSCETLVTSYPSNSGHIPGDSHLHRHSRENHKPDELILTINHLSTHWSGKWPLSLGFSDNILGCVFRLPVRTKFHRPLLDYPNTVEPLITDTLINEHLQ